MVDILLGLLAILAGGFMLIAGRFVLRFALVIWGFFAGFAFGAGLVSNLADERFLGTVLGWALGLLFALVFAIFAYLYYAVAVILVMAAFGFAIGSGLVVALGIDWNWLAILVGVVVGAAVGVLSVLGNMPMAVLIFLGSVAGALSVVGGLMLVFGSLNSADFTRGDVSTAIDDSWFWWLLAVALTVFGIVVQAAGAAASRRSVRAAWYAEPVSPS
ncbi:hypothetical protein [Nocardioides taihuensis]|uniref:DUF4203 domain-containing protein n=1 Tax=Nocardioides taihuensis TaxID=1835606 RepID=A0ABW0BLF2_9ACTN